MKMPTLFVAHGAPTLALEQTGYTHMLKGLVGTLPARPRAIVMFSAHWESAVQKIGSAARYETIHDFYGFPDELYRLRYPAPGDLALSMSVRELLEGEGIACEADDSRGLDHGAWAPLMLMVPEADIPVVAMSVHPGLAAEEQYRIGRALAPLRKEGVLIAGSGGIVHNLRRLDWNAGPGAAADWAARFDEWIGEQLETWHTEALFDYERRAPHARDAVPTPEHFVPLLLAMGAADEERTAKLLHREYQFGSLSLSCWRFGDE
ncbi:DODA-type extradiol aromatic ring-opening family dioxygenase [Paenibacillus chartarius]|uniref:DODA-type extradiol aromatic ring-opening family dioxygenase n=1 Tax=Paenibacillus chartarius TaxID=747481 RepID=A0ABV6DL56_9BACL